MSIGKLSQVGLAACVWTLVGCGGVDAGETGETVDASAQAFATYSGDFGLVTFNSGAWSFDNDRNGAWSAGDSTITGFGASGDIPLVGFGPVTCGAGGGKRGTYRPSTRQFFIDQNNNSLWDAGDTTINNFVTAGFEPFNLHPFIYTVPVSGNTCKGVLGFTYSGADVMAWIIDLNDNKVQDNGEAWATFGAGTTADDWPVPLYSATFRSSVMTVYRRNTGEWFQDINNNRIFDGCGVDACTAFGSISEIPFGHPNTLIRGTTRPNGTAHWDRFVDIDGNGWWNSATDKNYKFKSDLYVQLF